MDTHEARELDYGIAMSVNALVTAMGMQAENCNRTSLGLSPAYVEKDFLSVLEQNGVHHNAVIGRWVGK